MKKQLLLTLAAAAAMTVSCSKDQKQDAQNVKEEPNIQKTYATDCAPSEFPTIYSREFYQFKQSDLIQVNEYYSDGNCTQAAVQTRYNGTYEVKGESATIPGGRERTYTLSTVNITPLTQGGVDFLKVADNLTNCKTNDWVVGQPADFTDVASKTGCYLTDVPASGWLTLKEESNGDVVTLSKPTIGDVKPQSLDTKVYKKVDKDFK